MIMSYYNGQRFILFPNRKLMEKDLSQKVIRYAGSIFLLAGATLLIWQMTGPTWFKNIKAEITNQPYARTVTISAEGKITAKPDIANMSFSVVSEMPTVKQVTADNNQKMNKVIDAVKALGIEAKDITTSQYNLYPQYSVYPYDSTGRTPKIVGYHLDQQITVKVRKLDIVDDALDAATKAGANEVGSLTFAIDDTGPVKKQAREKAFATARQKADEMAGLAGVGIGRVITFNEEAAPQPPFFANYAMEAKVAAPGVAPAPTIEPGSLEMTVTVSVTYEIQ